jgi:hypothetical protein
MNTVVSDTNVIPITGTYNGKEQIFVVTMQGPLVAPIIMRNAGANQINYTFQEYDGSNWSDLDIAGTPLNDVLATGTPPTGVRVILIQSNFSQVRLLAQATGGSTLEFTLVRFYNRPSNGPLPLLLV